MRVLVVDNYDSFTFNLVQLLATLGAGVDVRENDRIDVEAVRALAPTHVVLSPGPGRPEDAGATLAIARAAIEGALDAHVLGVCLGHQALGLAAGARVVAARALVHGRASRIAHDGTGLFRGLDRAFVAGRYHSLAIDPTTLPASVAITARADDGEVMAIAAASGRVHGVQFHPESVLTPSGAALIDNFLRGDVR